MFPDDYRNDPDWEPYRRTKFFECCDCGEAIYENEDYYDFELPHLGSAVFCKECGDRWIRESQCTA